MSTTTRYRPPDASALARLGFAPEDAAWVLSGLSGLGRAEQGTLAAMRERLEARVGRLETRENVLADFPVEHPHGEGYLQLLALVEIAPTVHASMLARGVDDDVAWRSLGDLGQQVHIHRLVHGVAGFGATDWVVRNYNGCLLWLGRLQYTLEHDDELGWVFGCHIPETGPLSPEAVDESLALVRPIALPVFREFPVGRITCTSWLLDAGLVRRLPDESNVARFARRFTPCGTPADGRRDLLYFCFRVETASGQPVDLASLPRDSTLRRAALDLLHGEGPVVQEGWLPIP